MTLRFEPDADTTPSFNDEWVARYHPYLVSADPHQDCLRRADEQDCSIVSVCECHTDGPCDKECCS